MPPTEKDLEQLTEREAAALRALMDKRTVYRATGHGLAANTMGIAIWLVWQTWKNIPAVRDSAP